jgi:hypothetical protein
LIRGSDSGQASQESPPFCRSQVLKQEMVTQIAARKLLQLTLILAGSSTNSRPMAFVSIRGSEGVQMIWKLAGDAF